MIRRQLPYPYLLSGLLFAISIQAAAAEPLSAQRVRDPVLRQSVLMPIHASANTPITTRLPTHMSRRSFRADAPHRIARTANDRRVRNDIDGDGRTDLLWNRNFCVDCSVPDAAFAYWVMNGKAITGTAGFWYHRDYIVEATGDFDGDGRTDILWRLDVGISTIDHYYIWRNRGDGGFDGQYLASLQGANVSAVADIDGDGKDDLVLRGGSKGTFMRYWLLDGASIKRIGDAYAVAPADDFRITGIDDFDGDRRGDILWTHVATGDMYLWRGKVDGHFEDGVYIGTGNTSGRRLGDWIVQDLHDMDNDGRADIIWETVSSVPFGRAQAPPVRVAYWLMDGTTLRGIRVFDAPANGRIGVVGDLDGDGYGDFFWLRLNSGLRVQLWSGRADGGFDEHFIADYHARWKPID